MPAPLFFVRKGRRRLDGGNGGGLRSALSAAISFIRAGRAG